MAKLRVISGPHRGATFEFTADRVTVGRDLDNTIRLPDPLVSRHHAEFVREGAAYKLRDLNSTNGSYVDGRRIVESPVGHGNRIRLADVELEFQMETAPASPTNPDGNGRVLAKAPLPPPRAAADAPVPIAPPPDRGVWRPPVPLAIPDLVKAGAPAAAPPGPKKGDGTT